MKKAVIVITVITCTLFLSACDKNSKVSEKNLPQDGPIRLHPENPHYFLYQGKTLALVTSAEHYGAVLNLDFDFRKYLETLAEEGMNYTRIFTGTYFEISGQSFGIEKNTLAPGKGRVITPWGMVSQEPDGNFRYDLTSWNNAYFQRLKDFMGLASELGIIVEVTLFSSIYNDGHWDINPQNPENNINISHTLNRHDAQTLDNGELLEYQEQLVRKMVQELNEFDNFFFEIQNEPWSDHPVAVYNIINKEDLRTNDWTYKSDVADEAAMAWQEQMATFITEEESALPKKHLIAQNYLNFKAPVAAVSDRISIINFHYAWPEAAEWNYHYNRVLGFDESGFAGSGDQVYRRQAWKFMLSGGGIFNNLDYSFFVGAEDGTGSNNAPGGGSKTLRKQLNILSDFLHSFELEKLHPDPTCVRSAPGLIPYVLSDGSEVFAVYLRGVGTDQSTLELAVAEGNYQVQVLNTLTGFYEDPILVSSGDGILRLEIGIPEGELALKIMAV